VIPIHQQEFDELLDQYSQGDEPLENWATRDVVKLAHIADSELQARQPDAPPVETGDTHIPPELLT
jgi:hypothetical protein